MADWLVNIVSSDSGEASFVVDGSTQGQPLDSHQDDLVTWNNQTNDEHQPWQTDSSYNPLDNAPLVDPIPEGEPSVPYDCASPSQNPQHWTVYYYCRNHPNNPNERGSINVTAWPVTIAGAGANTSLTPSASAAYYESDDTISWFNHGSEAHQPCETDSNYSPVTSPGSLSGVLQPGDKSTPYAIQAPARTIYYFCYLHQNRQNERGTIVVTAGG